MAKARPSRSGPKPARRPAATLSHVGPDGSARMVDVSAKPVTSRSAEARGRIRITPAAMRVIREGRLPKGPVEEAARLAGVMAAKRTFEVIPLCHPLVLTHVEVFLEPRRDGFIIRSAVRTSAQTGAEMEALHAVAVAALTVYDMVKAVDRSATIEGLGVVAKAGGKSGAWRRPAARATS